uniref:Uncharacterized protein n=1 Tax=Arundo donax TaxID=35708 RepID=A0A0A9I223_ARUDO
MGPTSQSYILVQGKEGWRERNREEHRGVTVAEWVLRRPFAEASPESGGSGGASLGPRQRASTWRREFVSYGGSAQRGAKGAGGGGEVRRRPWPWLGARSEKRVRASERGRER